MVTCLAIQRSAKVEVRIRPNSRNSFLRELTTEKGMNWSSAPVRNESSCADVQRPFHVSGIIGLDSDPNMYFFYSRPKLLMKELSLVSKHASAWVLIAKSMSERRVNLSLIALGCWQLVDQCAEESLLSHSGHFSMIARCIGSVTDLIWLPGCQCESKMRRV